MVICTWHPAVKYFQYFATKIIAKIVKKHFPSVTLLYPITQKSIQKSCKTCIPLLSKPGNFKCLRAKTFTLCKILFSVPKLYIFRNKHTIYALVWFFYFLSLSDVLKFIASDGQTIYVCASRQRIEKCELLLKESEISRRSRGGGIEERSEEKPYRPGSLKQRCTLKRWPPLRCYYKFKTIATNKG